MIDYQMSINTFQLNPLWSSEASTFTPTDTSVRSPNLSSIQWRILPYQLVWRDRRHLYIKAHHLVMTPYSTRFSSRIMVNQCSFSFLLVLQSGESGFLICLVELFWMFHKSSTGCWVGTTAAVLIKARSDWQREPKKLYPKHFKQNQITLDDFSFCHSL